MIHHYKINKQNELDYIKEINDSSIDAELSCSYESLVTGDPQDVVHMVYVSLECRLLGRYFRT